MRRLRILLAVLALGSFALTAVPAAAGAGDDQGRRAAADRFELYTGTVDADVANELQQAYDHDVLSAEPTSDGRVAVQVILSTLQAAKLRSQGVQLKLARNDKGQTATQAATAALAAGNTVFRPYSGEGNIADEIRAAAAAHPHIAEIVVVGESLNGQEILALRVTKKAARVADGTRPAALYLGTQHAREWISPEVTRRLMHHFLDSYGSDAELTSLINRNEYWFLPVANPDGYDWTFEPGNRLWRKNLRDNDGNGSITASADGVDLNRNFETHWGYDDEGSSPDIADQTYRGKAPSSEPETQALDALMGRIDFNFLVNYHSAAELLLYGVGWQVQTPTPDDAIYEALAGTDENPAIAGFDPDLSAELYITNGDTTDHAHEAYGTLAFTPELSECQTVSPTPNECESVFNFPDDEALVQAEYDKNLPFALDIARSTTTPERPVSHLGNTTPDFVTDPFPYSYGDPQPVAVTARRSLGALTMRYRINNGKFRAVPTQEWHGGERYGGSNDEYYAEYRGVVTGTKPGDKVTVFFQAPNGRRSAEFTYQAVNESNRRVLILANEDYSGPTPTYAKKNRPAYLGYYTQALRDAGHVFDVYDVDARKRQSPHHLGVLGHYDAVVWYTGDDYITREPGQKPGTGASKLASDILLAVRDYMNEHGRVVYAGQRAGEQHATGFVFNPMGQPPYCPPTGNAEGCIPLSDDFLQYYLGAWKHNPGAGMTGTTANPVVGTAEPFADVAQFALNGGTSAGNQFTASSLLPTSSFLDPGEFPQFQSEGATMEYVRDGGAPYEPHSGSQYVFSQNADFSYKRLSTTAAVPAGGGTASFWISADTEIDWDYVVVEAHTAGEDDWTTLPDVGPNHLTTQGTGESCHEGWHELHPFLEHYQTRLADGSCSPSGSTGEWHALTGNTHGWKQWTVDLSGFAGKTAELSITYLTDWGTQGLGVFVDDAQVLGGPVEDFEGSTATWTPASPPAGSEQLNNWVVTTTAFEEGAAVATADSHYLGFGIEGVADRAARSAILDRALDDLLGG